MATLKGLYSERDGACTTLSGLENLIVLVTQGALRDPGEYNAFGVIEALHDGRVSPLTKSGDPAMTRTLGEEHQLLGGGRALKVMLSESGLPAEWAEVLQRMESALAEAEAATAERERELNDQSSLLAIDNDPELVWQQRLEHWDALVDGLQAFASQAEQKVVETSAALRDGEEALRGWLKTAESTRQRIADFRFPISD